MIIARRLSLFKESDLRTVADYVQNKTGEPTFWDVPSTYVHFSPLGNGLTFFLDFFSKNWNKIPRIEKKNPNIGIQFQKLNLQKSHNAISITRA